MQSVDIHTQLTQNESIDTQQTDTRNKRCYLFEWSIVHDFSVSVAPIIMCIWVCAGKQEEQARETGSQLQSTR